MSRIRTRSRYTGTHYDLGIAYMIDPKTARWVQVGTFGVTYQGGILAYRETCSDSVHKGPPYKEGGPVSIYKESYPLNGILQCDGIYYGGNAAQYRYIGGWMLAESANQWTSALSSANLSSAYNLSGPLFSDGDAYQYGASGWNRARPGRPTADLAVFLGELRDIPRMLKTTAKGFHNLWRAMGGHPTQFGPRHVADHWLNTQFGWLPFLNDLRKFYRTAQHVKGSLEFLKRHNGNWIRKRSTVVDQTDSIPVFEGWQHPAVPLLSSYYYRDPYHSAYTKRSYVKSKNAWFVGKFRYYLPDTGTWHWKARSVATMFGAMPTPSVLWELTPWSWLVDWGSNVGDVIGNLNDNLADNLVGKDAYVMCTTEYLCDTTCSVMLRQGNIDVHDFCNVVTKTRAAASPFGFSLTYEDLNPRQWSILAALGITRIH